MDPPQRTASCCTSSRRSAAEVAGNLEQFGRSQTSLHAERAAASLRAPKPERASAESLTLHRVQSSPPKLELDFVDSKPGQPEHVNEPEKSHEADQRSETVQSEQSEQSEQPVQPEQPVQSEQPVQPVQLELPEQPEQAHLPSRPHSTTSSSRPTDSITSSSHPTDPTSGSDGILERHKTKSSDSLAQTPANTSPAGSSRPLHMRRSLRPSLRRLQHSAQGGPMTYHDLGADYTRYYNPFSLSDSRRSSFSEKRTATPRPGAAYTVTEPTTPLAGIPITNPFLTPNVSTTKLSTLYDPEKNASVIDDRLAAPYEEKGMAAWPLIGDGEESDDEMHMPQDDDDIKYRPRLKDHFTRESIVSSIGLAVMLLGLLFIFVALPVMSFTGIIEYRSSWGVPLSWFPKYPKSEPWATVNDRAYPFLQHLRTGLIDPDTPASVMTRIGEFGDEYELVFSDEFNDNNRTFYEGDDPYFYAGNFWYGATQDLEWYDPDAVTTYDGALEIRMDKFPNHGLDFRSGMLNSWNQLCFKGGIFEVSVSLPGPGGIPGLWPGAWTMGNLGRPGYLSTTDGLWPYTYQACDVGITPNQSSPDGMSKLPGQRLPSCTCPGEDHPTPGKGRGAPEIDIIEVGATYAPDNMPIATQSYQVAPFDIWYHPNYNYTAFPDITLSTYNGYTGSSYQQAISATTNLNRNWFDGIQYQRYSFEYAPGEGQDAFISWKVGDQTMWMLDGRAIGPNGNIAARQISEEPMSVILNLGISSSWTWIDFDHLKFPTVMRVDYIRWYQKKGETMVTCDPPGFETTKYIKDHINAYSNPNLTLWDQTGHPWPKHMLNSDCSAESS